MTTSPPTAGFPAKFRVLGTLVLLFALLGGAMSALAEELFYKYENVNGVTVIDDHVPPQFAHKGYVVLNRAGRVVETVPRTLTAAELKSDSAAMRARLRAEEAERQRRYDEALLTRYSSVADIQDLERRRVNEIQVRINLQKGNIATIKGQLEQEQSRAAELEMAGEPVPAELSANVEALRASIAEEEARIEKLEQDKKTTEARYQFDIARFRAIRPEKVPAPQPAP